MDNIDLLKSLLSTNQIDRLKKEKAAQNRIDDPKLPRHTIYQGDRKIQQLGQDTIENGIVLNNQSVAIGDVMLPLAKGNVLRRVDNTNGGALLGTAYRDALENDFDANGNRRSAPLSRNGGNEPSDPNNPNKPRKPSDRVPPPFGCNPPSKDCFWSSNPTPPQGFQNYGDAVVNENAQPTYLHCKAGASVPSDLGCDFLSKWSCSGGVCSPNANGPYNSQAECEAALIPPTFTGGQCVGVSYKYEFSGVKDNGELWYNVGYGNNFIGRSTPYSDAEIRSAPQAPKTGAITSWAVGNPSNVGFGIYYSCLINGTDTGLTVFIRTNFPTNNVVLSSVRLNRVVRSDGLPDNCGNPPSTCP